MLTVVTPVFKTPNVSLSNFIYVVRYVHISGSLRTYKWFVTLTVATLVFKAPNVSSSHPIYVVCYVHLSGLLR